MYLNMGSTERNMNKIIGEINGTPILQYAHVGKRYFNRVNRIQKTTKIEEIRFDKIIKHVMESIRKNYDKCVTKNGRAVRNIVYTNFDVSCNNKKFNIEIAVLIKSTKVTWGDSFLKVVAKDYEEAYNKRQLKIGDVVIAIETIAATLKCIGEKRVSFTDQTIIDTIDLPKREYEVNLNSFIYMIRGLVNTATMRTNNAYTEYRSLHIIKA